MVSIYKKYLMILCALSASAFADNGSIHAPSMVGHLKVMQQIKERFLEKTKKIKPAKAVKTPTLTYLDAINSGKINFDTYLSKISWKAIPVKECITQLQQDYKPIIDQVIAREQEYCNSYYVLYHGQRREFRIWQDFLKEIYSFIHVHPIKEFEFLRNWYEAEKTFNIDKFIDDEDAELMDEQKKWGGWHSGKLSDVTWHDHKPYLTKNMLCVNLSLFGNLSNSGECSFLYFIENRNIAYFDLYNLFNPIFTYFGFNKEYLEKITALNKLIHTQEGSLLQIFVPKDKIDNYAYLSKAFGTPVRNAIDHTIFNPSKHRHMKLSPLLEMYIKNPSAMGEFDKLQARVLLSQDCLLNPASGVKFFRYTTVPDEKMAEYKKQLNELVKQMMAEWLEKKAYCNLKATTLERFIEYVTSTASANI